MTAANRMSVCNRIPAAEGRLEAADEHAKPRRVCEEFLVKTARACARVQVVKEPAAAASENSEGLT